jgi:hypothetical protein
LPPPIGHAIVHPGVSNPPRRRKVSEQRYHRNTSVLQVRDRKTDLGNIARLEQYTMSAATPDGLKRIDNLALFHAAGSNRTASVARMANLLQVSSAYGRAMESVNRTRMCVALYPVLRALRADARMDPAQIEAVIASSAEGHAFPTNLDRDPPVGGLAPASQQQLLRQALREAWSVATLADALRAQDPNRETG